MFHAILDVLSPFSILVSRNHPFRNARRRVMPSKSQGSSPFLNRVRDVLRLRHDSYRTEQTYLYWIRWFILFHRKHYPADMGEAEVAAFLSFLAVRRNVAPATQNQALNALVFLYRRVLDRPLGDIPGVVRARRRERVPVVLGRSDVTAVLTRIKGVCWLLACLQYGSGLRLMESGRLRVKDLDFAHRAVIVRHGKGARIGW
jgi:integrase